MKLIEDDGTEHDFPQDSAFIVFPPDDTPALLLPNAGGDETVPPHALFSTQVFVYMHEPEHVEDIVRHFASEMNKAH